MEIKQNTAYFKTFKNPQDSMVLVKGQTHRSRQQNRKSRNRPTQIGPIDFQQRCKDNLVEKGLSTNGAWIMQENAVWYKPHTLDKILHEKDCV